MKSSGSCWWADVEESALKTRVRLWHHQKRVSGIRADLLFIDSLWWLLFHQLCPLYQLNEWKLWFKMEYELLKGCIFKFYSVAPEHNHYERSQKHFGFHDISIKVPTFGAESSAAEWKQLRPAEPEVSQQTSWWKFMNWHSACPELVLWPIKILRPVWRTVS